MTDEPGKSSADTQHLAAIRRRIDELDEQIQQLISERALCAQKVGQTKSEDVSRPVGGSWTRLR